MIKDTDHEECGDKGIVFDKMCTGGVEQEAMFLICSRINITQSTPKTTLLIIKKLGQLTCCCKIALKYPQSCEHK